MTRVYEAVRPSELTDYIDKLEVASMEPDLGEAGAVDFRLTYGSAEQEDGMLDTLDAELRASTDTYISDLEMFVLTSPDYGLPSSVQGSYNQRPQHQSSGSELNQWLGVAKKHLPGAEGEVMDEIVTCIIDCFDPLQFELAINCSKLPKQPAREKLHQCASELASITTSQLRSYATSADTIQAFVDSSFMQTFGKNFDRIVLQGRILELKGELSSPAHATLVAQAEQEVITAGYHNISNRLGWILRRDPEATLRLIAEQPDTASKLRMYGSMVLSNVQPQDMTESHHMVLATLEEQASRDIKEYAEFVRDRFVATRSFSPEHISRLKSLAETTDEVEPWVYEVLYATLAVDEAMALVEQRPASLNNPQARAICVRRFAAEDQTEKAYELARTSTTLDTYTDALDPIRNLLAVYDETGHESAFLEAEQLQQVEQNSKRSHLTPDTLHELLARTFVAARKHGHIARAEQARASMEPYYSHERFDVRNHTLQFIMGIALNDGDLRAAERYAVQLKTSREQSPAQSSRGTDGLLYVLQAYVQTGDTQAATSLVQTYFATEKPHSALSTAMAVLNNKKPDYMPRLHGDHLNVIDSLMRPRR